MRAGHACLVVLHHEHGGQQRAEVAVDHHLHRDAAVDEQRGSHARRHGQELLALLVDRHVRRIDVAEVAIARIARVDGDRLGARERRDLVDVVGVRGPRLGRAHLRPPGGCRSVVIAPLVRHTE